MTEIKTVRKPFERVRNLQSRLKVLVLLIGDVVLYYVSLMLVLFLRYGELKLHSEFFKIHLTPFTIGLFIWLFIFYVGGLYDRPSLKNSQRFTRRFLLLVALGGLFLSMIFYFVPAFGIAPKANLFLFLLMFAIIGYAWRYAFNAIRIAGAGARVNKLVLIGTSSAAEAIARYLADNKQLGYEVAEWLKTRVDSEMRLALEKLIADGSVNTIVVPRELSTDARFSRLVYSSLFKGIEVVSLADFYELIFGKVALVELDEVWFWENIKETGRPYHAIKRALEVVFVLCVGLLLLPIMVLIALAIVATSAGPVFYKQQRVGKNGALFTLYKFRSMSNAPEVNPDAGAKNPIWTTPDDARVTSVGRVIRLTHLDELPQLWNVFINQMSLIGPRPGRPELDSRLEAEIPHYELRYLVRPGMSGWAQINYGYGASIEDEFKKLQYDMYYLKNKSFWFDLGILAKTLKKLFM